MTYNNLNINQRINAKANALIFYSFQRAGKGLLNRVSQKNPDMYTPEQMFLKPEYLNQFQREPKN